MSRRQTSTTRPARPAGRSRRRRGRCKPILRCPTAGMNSRVPLDRDRDSADQAADADHPGQDHDDVGEHRRAPGSVGNAVEAAVEGSHRQPQEPQGQGQALDVPERDPPEEVAPRSAAFSHDPEELEDRDDGAQAREALSWRGPVRIASNEHRPAGAHDHRESHVQGDRPALPRDPDCECQADAYDQRAVCEDRRDQQARTEEQRPVGQFIVGPARGSQRDRPRGHYGQGQGGPQQSRPDRQERDLTQRRQPLAQDDRRGGERGRGQEIEAAPLPLLGHRRRRHGCKHQQAEDQLQDCAADSHDELHRLAARSHVQPLDQGKDGANGAGGAGRAANQHNQDRRPARRPRSMPLAPEHGIAVERRSGQPSRQPADPADPWSLAAFVGPAPRDGSHPPDRQERQRDGCPQRHCEETEIVPEIDPARRGIRRECQVVRVRQEAPAGRRADELRPG